MKTLKRFISNWFGFSRTEVNGFLILLPLMLIILFSKPLYNLMLTDDNSSQVADAIMLDSLVAQLKKQRITDSLFDEHVVTNQINFHSFDPNKATENELAELGFSKTLSTRIANYRQKGGVFRIKRDLMKIYGMDSTLYHQLYSYIALPEEKSIAQTTKVEPVIRKVSKPEPFDINQADTNQLKNVYGIGPVLAKRILKFREGLGGFISNEQLSEVYGLDSLVLKSLKENSYIDDSFVPKKININTSDEKQLSSHPYIRKKNARAIMAYRFQHGNFTSVKEIRKIAVIHPNEAERIIPYLTVED